MAAPSKKSPPTKKPEPAKPLKPKGSSVLTLTTGFTEQLVNQPFALTVEGWKSALRQTEITDNEQKIRARPWLAWGVGVLLAIQNFGIWWIVVWALNKEAIGDLQLIFAALVGGTLTQSYFLLRLITEKVFGDINYHTED